MPYFCYNIYRVIIPYKFRRLFKGDFAVFFNFQVEVPEAPGLLVQKKRGNYYSIEYEYDRVYDPVKQYTYPKRAMIGRHENKDDPMMYPNENFLKYFPDAKMPDALDRTARSPYLNVGTFIVLEKIISAYKLPEMLTEYMSMKDAGLLLDLACYSIITEGNAAQYYPDYAFCHPLFTNDMKIYSDSKISDFLRELGPEQSVGFLNSWNGSRNHRERIYISYDSTNKGCQAGDIDIVEYGHPKVDQGIPVFNYSIAYDAANREPLFYEEYPGSINDVSQLRCAVDKAYSYGYRKLGFILDRGYFSRANITYLDRNGYSFVIMVKGMKKFIRSVVKKYLGTFENKRARYIDRYDVYGTTVTMPMYEGDEKERSIHLYFSDTRAVKEKQKVKEKIRKMQTFLDSCMGKEREFGPGFEEYFYLHYEDDGVTFKLAEEKTNVIEEELSLCGYFAIITSDKMTAKEAIHLYKSRDASEKLFQSDKSFLGNRSLRVDGNDAASSKIFIEFVALILRCRLYTCLKEKYDSMLEQPNYLTVPAAIRELEKVVMIRQLDGVYRLEHAVTKQEKVILDAFGLTENNIRSRAEKIGKMLDGIMNHPKKGRKG